jgi:regulator of vacuolar morphogenesis
LPDSSEANSLPTLFVAPAQTSGFPDSKSKIQHDSDPSVSVKQPLAVGFFADEAAYVAPATDKNTNKDALSPSSLEERYPDAQNSYYNILRHRFLLLRSTLRCTPPADAISALDDLHPISLPRNAGSAHKEWRRLLQAVDPHMVQVACMDMESVLRVLEILARMVSDVVRSEDIERVRRVGVWAWALLGKCREVGELATEEVGVIRNLGKRATTILSKVQETESYRAQEAASSVSSPEAEDNTRQDPPVNDEQETKQEEVPESAEARESNIFDAPAEQAELEAAKARLQARLLGNDEPVETQTSSDEESLVKQTRALLDMIITVVGEFYGQRDLLEAREVWV